MPTLIYIHGRGQKRSPEAEHTKWFQALRDGVSRLAPQARPAITEADLQLAYWSDLFYPPRGGASTRRGARAYASRTNPQGLDADEAAAVEVLTHQYWASQLPLRSPPPPMAATAPVPPRAMVGLRMAGRRRGGAVVKGPPVAGAVPVTTEDARAEQYEDSFVRDVVKYFALGYAEQVRQPLVKLLTTLPLDDGAMLVAHSFGTVIAYEVLTGSFDEISDQRAASGLGPLRIDTLVTMGGPLGYALDLQERLPDWLEQRVAELDQAAFDAGQAIQRMREQLAELAHHLWPFGAVRAYGKAFHLGLKQFPPQGVERWYNIYDSHDPVSYPPFVARLGGGAVTVGDTFLFNGYQRAFDIPIRNDFRSMEITLIDPEAHNDRGYGECAQLAQLIHDFWLRWNGPVSSAVGARSRTRAPRGTGRRAAPAPRSPRRRP